MRLLVIMEEMFAVSTFLLLVSFAYRLSVIRSKGPPTWVRWYTIFIKFPIFSFQVLYFAVVSLTSTIALPIVRRDFCCIHLAYNLQYFFCIAFNFDRDASNEYLRETFPSDAISLANESIPIGGLSLSLF